MLAVIAPYRVQGSGCIETRRGRRGDHEESGQPRGDKIDRIVQARGKFTEVEIALRPIADHRIKGADRFVGHRQRNAAEKKIKERRHDAIAGTLSQRLQTRTQHFLLTQIHGFPPDNMREFLSSARDVSGKQRRFHQLDRVQQSARS